MKRHLWQRLVVLFIILPALSSLLTLVSGASLLFIFTSPLFETQLTTFNFKVGLMSAAIGVLIIEITIWFKGIEYVFGTSDEEKK